MGESKAQRATKNSQKVASLEDQNKILEEVLKASREAAGNKSKVKANQEKASPGSSQDVESRRDAESEDKKRKAKPQAEVTPPAKKAKVDVQEVGNSEHPGDNEDPGNKQILEIPDYEANKEDDFDEGYPERGLGGHGSLARNQATLSDARRQKSETTRREHELSSEEEDDIEMFEDPHDMVNNDFLGDEAGWDRRSIASSAIFPSQGRSRKPSSTARPELGRSRSQQQRGQDGGDGPATSSGNTNCIEDLVKERAGVEQGKDLVGPPVADCIAGLLKTYLKEPSTEAMLKLVENYPRPANAEWLQSPTVGTQVAASIPRRSNNYDKRLRQSQVILGGSLAAMANVLQDIMYRGKEDESLLELARKVMDAMALSGYVHYDFNSIRKGAIRQVVNPNYAGVFTRRTSSTPENLLGESSVPDQLKEQDEISKVRAKLQKPRRNTNGENRQESARGRGRGFHHNNNSNRGSFSNRGSGHGHGSGFGNFPRGGRGSRPNYPQQRRVYGHNHNHQSNQDQKNTSM